MKTSKRFKSTHALSRVSKAVALASALVMLPMGVNHAGDEALYGPDAPPGSAFVRLFNASSAADLDAKVGNEEISNIDSLDASEFVFVPSGSHSLSVGSVQKDVQLESGAYYTAVLNEDAQADGITVIKSEKYSNRLKALVILYNLTDASDLSLRTVDGSTSVIDPVASQSVGTREVNPARIQLAVYQGEKKVASAPTVSFARGKAFSLFAVGSADAPRLVWASN